MHGLADRTGVNRQQAAGDDLALGEQGPAKLDAVMIRLQLNVVTNADRGDDQADLGRHLTANVGNSVEKIAARRNIVYIYHLNYIVAHPKHLQNYRAVPDGLMRFKGVRWSD